jgi:hypothetical protein
MRNMGVRTRGVYAPIGVLTVVAAMLKFAAAAGAAGMIWIHLCGSWTPGGGSTWGTLGVARSGASAPGVSTPYHCPGRFAPASSRRVHVIVQ